MEPEIVIAGISGKFPESDNVTELSENLFNKADLITEDDRRWKAGLHGLPRGSGKLKDITKFDSQFFGMPPKQAQQMDPQIRLLLEATHECIVDAGYNPEELRGKKIGVFIANTNKENDEYFKQHIKKTTGYTVTGCYGTMLPNRISYAFDFTGPSILMDTACSSGAVALCEAVRSIQSNDCEAAVVGASHLCLNPAMSMQFYKLSMISDDGKCKSFDAAANGYGRSEAIVTFLLQKSSMARRKYASIVHIKTNTDGFKKEGITHPSTEMQKRLIEEVYEECKLNPLEVSYVEAHGTGTAVGDPIEMNTITDIFCSGQRREPLLVGSVKSNMGHTEPASGLCSAVKVIIAMEKGMIPPNLHFKNPNLNIRALFDGRVKIVTEPTPWNGAYASINSYGLGGVNVHAVLKSNTDVSVSKQMIPQLVLYSGRTEESVQYMFRQVQKDMPGEFFKLLHSSCAYTSSKPFRGYKLIDHQALSGIKKVPHEKRPVWYIFSGMGTHWSGMAKSLLNLNPFAESIKKCAEILKPYGVDLMDWVTKEFRTITSDFVSIATVQIALVDLLASLGIKPDGITGHSAGELICAYADGCLSMQEAITAAFMRGRTLDDTPMEEGAMAALGVSWSEAEKLCPEGVFPSCNNAQDSVTVSGTKIAVQQFVKNLQAKNIFAKDVDSSGCAFHSKYVYPAAAKIQQEFQKLIPNPKPRSSRWISSTYPESKWSDPEAKVAGATYFLQNLVSPVLFYEALQKVPKNAIVIEIGPHHLLQAILKRVIGPDAEYIGLMKRNVDNIPHVLMNIGRLYNAGLNPQIDHLYPEVRLPAPRGTPMISPLIQWDHSESWPVPRFDEPTHSQRVIVDIGPKDSPDHFLSGHYIDGRYLYPGTGYLVLAWKALAQLKNREMTSLPVHFEGVKIHKATVLSKTASTELCVDITSADGEFEISENNVKVCTGRVYSPEEETTATKDFSEWEKKQTFQLNQKDIYKELKLRGYEYGKTFQGITCSNLQRSRGLLTWTGDWIVFLDTMMQLIVLGSYKRGLYLPTRLQSVKINPLSHDKMLQDSFRDLEGIPVVYDKNTKCCRAGGVEMKHLKATFARRRQGKRTPTLSEYHFVPYNETQILLESEKKTLEHYIRVCTFVAKSILDKSDKYTNFHFTNNYAEIERGVAMKHLEKVGEREILLQALKNAQHAETSEELTGIANDYTSKRGYDILWETMFGDRLLRMLFDIVLENTTSKELKISEAADGQRLMSIRLEELAKTLITPPPLNFTVAHVNPDCVMKEELKNIDIMKWDPDLPLGMKDVDFFVINCNRVEQTLRSAASAVKDNGFVAVLLRTKVLPAEMFLAAAGETVIPVQDESDFELICEELNLATICKKSDSLTSTLYLLRKVSHATSKNVVVVPLVDFDYEKWVDRIKGEISQWNECKRIWLVSESSAHSGIIGLVNCLRQERKGTSIRCLFRSKADFSTDNNNQWFQDLVRKDLAMNVYQGGVWGSYRYLKFTEGSNKRESSAAYLNFLTRGDLSSFVWISPNTLEKSVLCQVYYAPLNFRDIMLASGKLPPDAIPGDLARQDCILGLEFSGRLSSGKRVMGSVPAKGLATSVAFDPDFLWDVPDEWTLEEASTVPIAYSTAYYALVVRGGLRKGEKVLIHSGSGGVGQAAISIALAIGCQVFTTVGSPEKKEFLKKRFKALEERHFCNSRDTSFEEHILDATNGEGVDVILNSLADQQLKATLNCLSQHGRFLEIGKYDLSNNSSLGMAIFLKNISFHGILLDALFENTSYSRRVKKQVVQLVKDGMADGTVKPLNSIVYNHDEAEQAFRFMASGKHIGKVILKIREEETNKNAIPKPVKMVTLARTKCNPMKSYVIVGGLGGFGLELCHWLIEKGAHHVILTSRSGVKSGYQQLCLQRWKEEGVNVTVSHLNASNIKETESLLRMASSCGSVGGIFNLALVLRDAFMENQTVKNFEEVGESKIQSTLNLDQISRKLCPELEWFVCFSSVSCGRGNAGQSNYGFANSVMERICEERCKQGLPGLAVQWGAVGGVGVVEDTLGSDAVVAGTLPQPIHSCLTVLDKFLQQSHPVVSSFVPCQLSQFTPKKQEKRRVLDTIANIFGLADIPSPESTLGELGMDSLMGVEVSQYLEREFELSLGIPELRQLKIKDLKKLQDS